MSSKKSLSYINIEADKNKQQQPELLQKDVRNVELDNNIENNDITELQNTLNYQAKIVESYGYDTYTGDFNEKVFPITKEDKQMDSIAKDFKAYFKTCSEYEDYLKKLIKRYEIKPSGNILKRVAFTLKNDNLSQHNSNYITTAIDYQTFS